MPPAPPPGEDGRDEPAPLDPEEAAGGPQMGFFDHLEELRKVLVRCALALLIGMAVTAIFLPQMAHFLRWPLEAAMADLPPEARPKLVTTGAFSVFGVAVQLLLAGGAGLSLPFILLFLSQFLAPALRPQELRVARPALLAGVALFLVGACFSYLFLLPAGLKASLLLNQTLGFEEVWDVTRYYEAVIWMTAAVGLGFEFPLVLVVLIHLELLSTAFLAQWRNVAWVFMLVLSAVITPTADPVTFLLLALPLVVLYEVAILVGRWLEFRRRRRRAREGWDDDEDERAD